METQTMVKGFSTKPSLENSIHYIAHTFSFLATADDTNGEFTLIHCHFRKGFMPPAHYHTREDESFFILEGEYEYCVGDQKFNVGPGGYVFLPKNIPHYFNLITETGKALLLITPAGMESFFRDFSQPASTLDLPPVPTFDPRSKHHEIMNERMIQLGVHNLPEF